MAATDAFSLGAEEAELPFSILDTDLYKVSWRGWTDDKGGRLS